VNLMEMMKDLYDNVDLANNDMEVSVISGKSFGYIMDDYFGAHLNTMVEVFKDINDDKLQVRSRKILEETTSRLHKN